MKVAAFGDNCIDYYSNLGRYYVTGNVVDFALNIKKLSEEVSVVSVTGNDSYGKDVLNELNCAGIDISHLRIDDGPTAVCYMELINKERVHGRYDEGVMEDVIFTPEQVAFVSEHEYVHMAFYGHTEQFLPLLKEKGCIISFDYSDDLNSELVNKTKTYVDYPFFSYKQDDYYIRNYLKDKVDSGARTAVATFGEAGSLAYDGSRFYRGNIVPAVVTNTIGAGDSFIAGFMHGIMQSQSIQKCLEIGAEVSSEVVSVFGPWKKGDACDLG